jgi:hypothetical protein
LKSVQYDDFQKLISFAVDVSLFNKNQIENRDEHGSRLVIDGHDVMTSN